MIAPIAELECRSERGRVIVWLSQPLVPPTDDSPIVVISSGFCRRMPHLSIMARMLAENGASVVRYDPVDHPGQSEGDPERFTMSSGLESLRAVVDLATGLATDRRIVLVPVSLSARVAYRLASFDSRIAEIVSVVGVVNVVATLREVFGTDYFRCRLEELPEYVHFERKPIRALPFRVDSDEHRWTEIGDTCTDLQAVKCPITNFRGSNDGWVDPADLLRAFATGDAPRQQIEVSGGEHDLAKNPVAAHEMLVRLVEIVCRRSHQNLRAPDLGELAAQMGYERRLAAGREEPRRLVSPSTIGKA